MTETLRAYGNETRELLINGLQETKPAGESLHRLWATIHMEKEVGDGLGPSEELQREMPETPGEEGRIMKLLVAILGS